jgi:solute carrier family 25 phosphate transporter 3
MLAATVSIVKSKEGPGVLLTGLGPTVVGYGIEGAMKFGIYEVAKPVFGALLPGNKGLAFCFSSVVAGAVAALLLCPMESLRIRQVTDASYANDSLLTGLPKPSRSRPSQLISHQNGRIVYRMEMGLSVLKDL